MGISKNLFGCIGDQEVHVFTLTSALLEVSVIEYGARIKTLFVKDKSGNPQNVVIGLDTLEDYVSNHSYFGAVCGRHANRIEGARLSISGITYNLENNEGKNSLHSGSTGFHSRIFTGEIVGDTLEMSLVSPHLDQGFPGTMNVKVIYSLTKQGGLHIEYHAVSDRDTVCNLTNHAYFNLEGDDGTILDHQLMLASDFYTPVKTGCLPTGEIISVSGTAFDFTSARRIGDPVEAGGSLVPDGFDHNFVLHGHIADPVAVLSAPRSGICMQVFTTMPGLQFYSGNYLEGILIHEGKAAIKHQALCLETQYFPNAFQYSHFPQPVIKAGEPMTQTTEYRFSLV